MKKLLPKTSMKPAYWKSAIIAGIVLLAIGGLLIVMFNLPVVTGSVPQ